MKFFVFCFLLAGSAFAAGEMGNTGKKGSALGQTYTKDKLTVTGQSTDLSGPALEGQGYWPTGCYQQYSKSGKPTMLVRLGDFCKDGSMACFEAGTMVSTPNGLKAIESLVSGDEVISMDPNSLASESPQKIVTKVATVSVREVEESGHLNVPGAGDLYVTPEHPFYAAELKQFIAIGEMPLDQSLVMQNSSGRMMTVSGFRYTRVKKKTKVYNLHLTSEPHNYLVGGVLVHNKL